MLAFPEFDPNSDEETQIARLELWLEAERKRRGGGQPLTLVGIDPGKDGAISIRREDQFLFFDTPTVLTGVGGKRDYNAPAMSRIIANVNDGRPLVVAIEKQQAMPAELHGRRQGTVSSFSTGYGYGVWMGILAALRVPVEIVAPQSWKAKMLIDAPKGKEASRQKALQLFPQLVDQLKLKKHEARAESLLIAEFVRRHRLSAA